MSEYTFSSICDDNRGPGSSVVFVDDLTGYFFYPDINGRIVFRKTADGGETWAAASLMHGTGWDINDGALAVWYDQWTPGDSGTKIHIAVLGALGDCITYSWLDTADDSKRSTFAYPDGVGYAYDTNDGGAVSICKSTDGEIFVTGGFLNGSMQNRGVYRSVDLGANWTNVTPSGWSSYTSQPHVLPLSGGDVLLAYHTGGELRSTVWDKGTTDWIGTWTVVDSSWTANSAYPSQWGGTIDPVSGDAIIVGHTYPGNATGALKSYRYSDALRTWGAGVTVDDNDGNDCLQGIPVVDQNKGHVYAVYLRGAIGSSMSVYWRKSTDGCLTWGAESAAVNTATAAWWILRGTMMGTERLYVVAGSNLGSFYGNTLVDLEPFPPLKTTYQFG